MIETKARSADASPVRGWDPARGVFLFPESDPRPGVLPGVALLGPNGRRAPARKPIVITDPARLFRRRRCACGRRGRPGALKVAAWIVGGVSLGALALWAAASCVGSF